MINLMPPTVKEQMRYSRYNRSALHYLQLVVLVVAILAAIFTSAIYFLDRQLSSVTTDLTAKQAQIAEAGHDKAVAADAASRVAAIKYIQSTQTKFSVLLSDLAAVLPANVALSGIALTGDATKPVVVTVSGSSYDAVLSFRDAIVTSPRIAAADLQSISSSANGYSANVVLGFKPGEAQ